MVTVTLYGKPQDADYNAPAEILLRATVPEFVHVRVPKPQRVSGPDEWWWSKALPYILEGDRLTQGRYLVLVEYPNGTRETLVEVRPLEPAPPPEPPAAQLDLFEMSAVPVREEGIRPRGRRATRKSGGRA